MKRDQWFPTSASYLCSTHFEEKYMYKTNDQRRLLAMAVPTIFSFAILRPEPRKRASTVPNRFTSRQLASSDDESQEEGSESSNNLEKKEKNQTLTDPLLPSVQMLPKNLHLKKSSSNEKEYGVWSSTTITKGVIFGPYNGIYLDVDDGELDENDYRLKELKDNDIVYFMNNKNNEHADWFQYVNFTYHREQQNLVILKCGGHVYYETIKDILPDSELLVQFSHKRESRRNDHTSKRAEEMYDLSKPPVDNTQLTKITPQVKTFCDTEKISPVRSKTRSTKKDTQHTTERTTTTKNCHFVKKIPLVRRR